MGGDTSKGGPGGLARTLLTTLALVALVPVAMLVLARTAPPPPVLPVVATTSVDTLYRARPLARAVLDLVAAHDRRLPRDWATRSTDALERASDAMSPEEAYLVLTLALRDGNRIHAELVAPADVPRYRSVSAPADAVTVLDGVATVRPPTLPGVQPPSPSDWAKYLAVEIDRARPAVTCGWVLDLRDNRTDLPWPLLAGLSPLLPGGRLFDLQGRDGRLVPVTLAGGQAYAGQEAEAAAPPLPRSRLPVAVLQDWRTTGGAEAAVVALSQRPLTRSFGTATGGHAALREAYDLPDGGLVVVETHAVVGPGSALYPGGVVVDVPVTAERVEATALAWLRAQCAR